MRPSIVAALVLLLTCPTCGALAQEQTGDAPAEATPAPDPRLDEARARLGRGESLYDAGDFEGALAEFGAVERLLEGHPLRALATWNRGRALERLFRYDEAVALYERYLAEPDPDGTYVALAREKLELLRTLLGTAHITIVAERSIAAWELWIDGHAVGETRATLETGVRLPGGRHTIEARSAGTEDARAEVEILAGVTCEVSLTLREPRRGVAPTAFVVVGSLALALGLVAVVLGPFTLAESARLDACIADRPCADRAGWIDDTSGAETAALVADRTRLRDMAIATDVVLVAAGASAVAGIVLAALTDWDGGATPDHATALLMLSSPGADVGLSIAGRFE